MGITKVQTVNSINGEIFSKVTTLQGLSFYSDSLNQRVAIVAEKNNEVLAMVILIPSYEEGGGGTLILQTGEDVGEPMG